jgi:hypothetical protein
MSDPDEQLLAIFTGARQAHGDFASAWQAVKVGIGNVIFGDGPHYEIHALQILPVVPLHVPDPKRLQKYLPRGRKPTPEEIKAAWHKALSKR